VEATVQLLVLAELSGEDPYQRALLSRVRQEHLGQHLRIMGHTDPVTVATYLAASDACVLPFVEGAQPRNTTLLAAMSQGVLSVTTSKDRRGYEEETNVFYVAPGDVTAMAGAIQRLAGSRPRVPAPNLPTWSAIACEHLRLYEDLFRKCGGRESDPLSSA